jgi:hypothetical protein
MEKMFQRFQPSSAKLLSPTGNGKSSSQTPSKLPLIEQGMQPVMPKHAQGT